MATKPPGEHLRHRFEPLAVLAYIADYQQRYPHCTPSEQGIQKDLGITAPSVVQLILQRLERAGLLIITRYGEDHTSDLMLTQAGQKAAQLWQEEHTYKDSGLVVLKRRTRGYSISTRHKSASRGSEKQRFRRLTIHQPTTLLISSNPAGLATVYISLTERQFAVFATASPLEGYNYAVRSLGMTLSSRKAAILIDTGDVYSVLVAAGLAQRMQQQVIPPTWLIALLDTHDPERELEARLVGCQEVLHLPLDETAMRTIQQLIKHPAPLPHTETEQYSASVIKTLQTIADRMLHAALEVQPDQWTARDVACLLYYLTLYPVYPDPSTSREEQWMHLVDLNLRTEQIIRTLGGIQAARQFLAECVHSLEAQYPLHSKVLEKFLSGWQRKTIVRHFVERGLYEDTRIYACIKELPQRISDMLKIQGA